jgi:hypothetical protein
MQLATLYTDRKALAITLCWVAVLAATGSTAVLLFLAPALLIVIPLLGGRYVGEGLIAKLAAKPPRQPRRPVTAPSRRLSSTPAGWRPRGADLIAFSLAKRPPPLRLLPQN